MGTQGQARWAGTESLSLPPSLAITSSKGPAAHGIPPGRKLQPVMPLSPVSPASALLPEGNQRTSFPQLSHPPVPDPQDRQGMLKGHHHLTTAFGGHSARQTPSRRYLCHPFQEQSLPTSGTPPSSSGALLSVFSFFLHLIRLYTARGAMDHFKKHTVPALPGPPVLFTTWVSPHLLCALPRHHLRLVCCQAAAGPPPCWTVYE